MGKKGRPTAINTVELTTGSSDYVMVTPQGNGSSQVRNKASIMTDNSPVYHLSPLSHTSNWLPMP